MYHCNASGRLPWKDPHDPVVCELGRGYDGECADHLVEMEPDTHLWALWENDRFTYAVLRPCCMSDPTVDPVKREPCTLFVEHPPGHSWEFRDMLHG